MKKTTICFDINNTIRNNISQFIFCYKKYIDNSINITPEDVTEFEPYKIFKFNTMADFNNFYYVDYPYELFAIAQEMDKMIPAKLNLFIQNNLTDFEEEYIPHIMYASPYEADLTIQATLSFLSRVNTRVREIYFPQDSSTIWDKADIVITANPYLIEAKPNDKDCIKINAPYNKNVETEYIFDSLIELVEDDKETLYNLVEKHNNRNKL